MKKFMLLMVLAVVFLLAFATDADAGIFRRRCRPAGQGVAAQPLPAVRPAQVLAAPRPFGGCAGGSCPVR